jgi:acetolactate synthase-1/2/3 large subunit
MADVDEKEIAKHQANQLGCDIKDVIETLVPVDRHPWLEQCRTWNNMYPWLESGTHDDANGYINSYRFTDALSRYFADDEIIVTDMGSPLISAHYVLHLKPPQRIMTSGGLGEMGCALPAAIGAHFGSGKRVICLHADGGMMLNLQELQTIYHHQLPVKIIIYENDGYLMLKHTQRVGGMQRAHSDPASGVSLPDFRRLAASWAAPGKFGFNVSEVRNWKDFERLMPQVFNDDAPCVVVYHMDPEQPLVPRLLPINGRAPRIDEMTPSL